MSKTAYQHALKLGEKSSKAAAARGEYPYLPALDEFLKSVDVLDEVPLGIMEIPLEQIVGTKTAGRQTAFAPNFMPLMDMQSEFAVKWCNLYDYQLSEGVRDPIIAYEFMNRYYVLEGNKRVSVFKYLNSFSIEGKVIRIVPRRSSDPQVRIFYEYMDFYRHSQINYIWFSKEGGFTALTKAVGIRPDTDWTDEQRADFSSVWLRFSKIFEEKGGKKLGITVGDALLAYLAVFSWQEIPEKTDVELKAEITKVWSEFEVLHAAPDQTLVMDPRDAARDGMIARFLKLAGTGGSKYLKVAFVHELPAARSGWTYSHELGRLHLEQVFGEQIRTSVYTMDEHPGNRQEVISAAAEDGNHIIFTTNEMLLADSLKAAVRYPEVKILNCCVNRPHKLLRTYYGRMYEAKFLEGMIAGATCGNDRIAFVADYPIWGSIANINAFALGAQMTNPRARIFLHWNSEKDSDLDSLLERENIHVVSDVDAMRPGSRNRRYGLYTIRDGRYENLAVPMWNWGKFYEKILRDILSGSWETAGTRERPALNYWWGISGDIVDLILARRVPSGLQTLVGVMRDQIYNDHFHPFSGRISRQDGSVIEKDYPGLTAEEIITMNWLCENVCGSIPSADRLRDSAKELVAAAGVMLLENE